MEKEQSPGEIWRVWLRPADVEKLRIAQEEGFSHVTVQMRVDRFDDYYTEPFDLSEASDFGATDTP